MKLRHVVVDGSNIATEGRETPSLAQLDEAVQAFIREFEPERVTVVVDATFPNRIGRQERKVYEDAVTAGEVITPPAGAIGRGDAFVLQIADRAGATVLSNDSFQEFHGEYPWLFEQGRLVGGKPVAHVGWVFMDRAPVRGPASRRSMSEARRVKVRDAKAERAEKRAEKAAAAPSASAPTPTPAPVTAKDGAPAPPAKRRRSKRGADEAQVPPSDGARPAASSRDEPSASTAKRRRGRGAASTTEAPAADAAASSPQVPVPAEAVAGAPDATATPEYNEPGPYGDFLSKHPVGSDVEAVVESFGSHGAYLRCGPIRAYAPLKNLADPAPRSAKEVLKTGESRTFVVAEVDRARRGVDLALSGTPAAKAARAARQAEPPKPAKAPKARKASKAPKTGKAEAKDRGKAGAKDTAKASKPRKAVAKDAAKPAKEPKAQKDPQAGKATSKKATTKKQAGKKQAAAKAQTRP